MPRTSIPCMNYPGSRIEGAMEDWKLRKSLELPRVLIPLAACGFSLVGKQRIFHDSDTCDPAKRSDTVAFPRFAPASHIFSFIVHAMRLWGEAEVARHTAELVCHFSPLNGQPFFLHTAKQAFSAGAFLMGGFPFFFLSLPRAEDSPCRLDQNGNFETSQPPFPPYGYLSFYSWFRSFYLSLPPLFVLALVPPC